MSIAIRGDDKAPTTDAGTLLAVLSASATNPNVDVGKIERLYEIYSQIRAKDAEQAFNEAMNAAQTEMGRIKADAKNPETHSKYATYAALDKELRPIYTKHGFALSFGTQPNPEQALFQHVVCDVTKGGHTKRYGMIVPADGKGPKGGDVMTKTHAAGAAMSYGMRYLLKSIFNVAIGEDDDDGNSGEALPNVWKNQETRKHYSTELQRAWGKNDGPYYLQLYNELDTDQQANIWRDFNSVQRREMTDMIKAEREKSK